MPSREEVAAYLSKHNLEANLELMANDLSRERPRDPAAWMSGYLAQAAGAATAASGRPLAVKSTLRLVTGICQAAQDTAFPELTSDPDLANRGIKAVVREATQPDFGDYQNNSAMLIFAAIKGRPGAPANARAVAERIVQCMRGLLDNVLGKVEIAGPGYVNMWLSDVWLEGRMVDAALHGLRPPVVRTCTAVVDFSSPNVAKEMHVGHLRSTIIGDVICRVLEYCGFDVRRVNHVGDWGTQFGMLIAHMQSEHPDFLKSPPPISDLQKFYKAAKVRFDEDEAFKKAAHDNVVKLQAGDATCRAAWHLICEASRLEFEKVYRRLDIRLEEVGESFYNPYIPAVVAALEAYGHVQLDDGAKLIFPRQSKHKQPLIVVKRDGGFNYDSTDMAAIWYRVCELGADWVIYVVDEGQGPHFDLVFQAARDAGWTREHTRLQHVGFGLVQGEDGKRFRTRSGDTVRLVDLLDEARDRMRKSFEERQAKAVAAGGADGAAADTGAAADAPGPAGGMTSAEMDRAAEVMGYAAVKYADLKNNRANSYQFSYERALSTTGNTAVYLLYAHARVCSILDKSGMDIGALKRARTPVILGHAAERAFAACICRFQEKLEDVLRDLLPNVICEFLYDVCSKMNQFILQCRVIGVPETPSRLMLCAAGVNTMRACFQLLGITWLERI